MHEPDRGEPLAFRRSVRAGRRVPLRFAVGAGWVLLACLVYGSTATAKPPTPAERDRLAAHALQRAGDCRSTRYVSVCVERGALTEEQAARFVALADEGAVAIRVHLGAELDLPGGNDRRVAFFVGSDVGPPHVTINREPWIFMHPETIRADHAPYLHEMVHAMAQWSWRRSEWIAEGYANHVAAAVVGGTRGYHRSFVLPDGLRDLQHHRRSPQGRAMLPLVGADGRRSTYAPVPAALFRRLMADRSQYAPPFYALAWSFVDYLVDAVGVQGLRAIATADDQQAAAHAVSGRTLDQLKQAWLASLDAVPDAAP